MSRPRRQPKSRVRLDFRTTSKRFAGIQSIIEVSQRQSGRARNRGHGSGANLPSPSYRDYHVHSVTQFYVAASLHQFRKAPAPEEHA